MLSLSHTFNFVNHNKNIYALTDRAFLSFNSWLLLQNNGGIGWREHYTQQIVSLWLFWMMWWLDGRTDGRCMNEKKVKRWATIIKWAELGGQVGCLCYLLTAITSMATIITWWQVGNTSIVVVIYNYMGLTCDDDYHHRWTGLAGLDCYGRFPLFFMNEKKGSKINFHFIHSQVSPTLSLE